MTRIRAIALLSGGLDSILAAKLVLDQGVEVTGLHILTPFSKFTMENAGSSPAAKVAKEIGIELTVIEVGEEYLEIVKHPKFGYGRGANPCIDCHAYFIKKAFEVLQERSAHFVITGEVIGQRPMSQRKQAIGQIDRETGIKGLILRPLSAQLLPETIPEQKKWVDREKLLAIAGRSRKQQFELAERLGIKGFSAPAGGCLLTMEEFGKKVKDLLAHQPDFGLDDAHLLKISRHFRLSPLAKAVVGKNDPENKKIIALARSGDILVYTDNVPGPAALVRGQASEDELSKAAGIVAYYVHKSPGDDVPLILERIGDNGKREKFSARPLERSVIESLRIK